MNRPKPTCRGFPRQWSTQKRGFWVGVPCLGKGRAIAENGSTAEKEYQLWRQVTIPGRPGAHPLPLSNRLFGFHSNARLMPMHNPGWTPSQPLFYTLVCFPMPRVPGIEFIYGDVRWTRHFPGRASDATLHRCDEFRWVNRLRDEHVEPGLQHGPAVLGAGERSQRDGRNVAAGRLAGSARACADELEPIHLRHADIARPGRGNACPSPSWAERFFRRLRSDDLRSHFPAGCAG